jgi:hypothetical protein
MNDPRNPGENYDWVPAIVAGMAFFASVCALLGVQEASGIEIPPLAMMAVVFPVSFAAAGITWHLRQRRR